MLAKEFFSAIRSGDADTVLQLTRTHPSLLQSKHPSGISPILFAAYHERPQIATLLAERKVILDIFEAIAVGALPRVVRMVTTDPEKVHTTGADGITPLMLAAYLGYDEICAYLIQAGAWVNQQAQNELENAPLHQAAVRGHNAVCALLLHHDANPNIQNAAGETPLLLAVQEGHVNTVRLLLFGGADMSLKNEKGQTALEIARQNTDTAIINLLRQGITRRFKPVLPPST